VRYWKIGHLAWTCSNFVRLGAKRMGRPCAGDPRPHRAERPPRQPRTLSVTIVGCSMCIWACSLRVDRGMVGFKGPSSAHCVVCALLFWAQNTKLTVVVLEQFKNNRKEEEGEAYDPTKLTLQCYIESCFCASADCTVYPCTHHVELLRAACALCAPPT
jgi:hypothetical protein